MVYVDSDEIKWLPYVKSWVNKLPEKYLIEEMKTFITELFELAIDKGFAFIRKNCDYAIHQVLYFFRYLLHQP